MTEQADRALGWPQCSMLVAGGEGVVELFAIGGDFVAEAGGEELVAEMAEFVASGAGGVACRFCAGSLAWWASRCCVAELGGVGEDGRLHDLEILLVLRGGAGRDFVEPLADVGFV